MLEGALQNMCHTYRLVDCLYMHKNLALFYEKPLDYVLGMDRGQFKKLIFCILTCSLVTKLIKVYLDFFSKPFNNCLML